MQDKTCPQKSRRENGKRTPRTLRPTGARAITSVSGIQLLLNSRAGALDPGLRGLLGSRAGLDARAAPWEAWLLTNEAFALYGRERFTDWRLFQLGFIFAHIPTFASRMPEFADQFDADRDALSSRLLYFATGGGKSEAFFGLLVFSVFLDRLRGKQRGVTALVR